MSEPHSARCCAERTRQFLCWNCGRVKTQILVVLQVQCRQLKQPANISPNTARERVTPLMSGELGALIWGPDLSCFWVCLMLFRPTALQGSETDPQGPMGWLWCSFRVTEQQEMSTRLWKTGHDPGFDATVTHSALSADFTSPGALAFVLGVDLAPGLQEQYSETTEFNLAEWFLMFLIGSGRPGKNFDASTFTMGFSFTAWREQDWNLVNCQYWLKKNWNAFSPSLICIGHFIQKNRENCHKSSFLLLH